MQKIENGEIKKGRRKREEEQTEALENHRRTVPKPILKSAKKATAPGERRPIDAKNPRSRARLGNRRGQKTVSFKSTCKKRPKGRGEDALGQTRRRGSSVEPKGDSSRRPADQGRGKPSVKGASTKRASQASSMAKDNSLRKSKCFKCGDLEKVGIPLPKKELFRNMSKGRYTQEKRRKLNQRKRHFKKYTFKLNKRVPSQGPSEAKSHARSSKVGQSRSQNGQTLIAEYKKLIGELDQELASLEGTREANESLRSDQTLLKKWDIEQVLEKCIKTKAHAKAKTLNGELRMQTDHLFDKRMIRSENQSNRQGPVFDLTKIKLDQSWRTRPSCEVRTIHRNQIVDLGFYHDLNFL